MLEINCKQMHRHTDCQAHRQTDEHKKPTLFSVLVPHREYLYYPLNVDGVTLKGSLLPTSTRLGDIG